MKRYEATAEEMEPVDDPMVGIGHVEEEDSKSGFPDEYMEPLRGLLFVGKLSKNFRYAGHDFLIETLTEGRVIRIGQLVSTYKGTFSESEARKAFTVAACVSAVDGYPIVSMLKPGDDLNERVAAVLEWYPPVIDYVYRRYLELEMTEFEVANALKK